MRRIALALLVLFIGLSACHRPSVAVAQENGSSLDAALPGLEEIGPLFVKLGYAETTPKRPKFRSVYRGMAAQNLPPRIARPPFPGPSEPGVKIYWRMWRIRGKPKTDPARRSGDASGIAPQLGPAVREAFAEVKRTGKTARRDVGRVRIEVDQERWRLLNRGSAIPVLMAALESPTGATFAPAGLADVGTPAQKILIDALNDPKRPNKLRAAVAETLGRMECRAAVPALLKALDEPDSEPSMWFTKYWDE
jgi:hypothetical protein